MAAGEMKGFNESIKQSIPQRPESEKIENVFLTKLDNVLFKEYIHDFQLD